jgi:hypothetical protein
LPVWQGLYEEYKDRNFVIISVALDTGGPEATRQWIRPADPAAYPKVILDLMGLNDAETARLSTPIYPCLIDERHLVAELYNTVNVPMAVWIDEKGRMVRPPEPPGTTDAFRSLDRTTFRMPDDALRSARLARKVYVGALRDWIENGEASKHVLSPAELRRRISGPGHQDALAAANFRLAVELRRQGQTAASDRHLAEARRLRPDSWSYRRQSWELEQVGKASGPDFWAAVDALGDKPYYPPVDIASG